MIYDLICDAADRVSELPDRPSIDQVRFLVNHLFEAQRKLMDFGEGNI